MVSTIPEVARFHTKNCVWVLNNALFNAINELSDQDKKASEQLRRFQIYNYELGLQAIEEALSESDKADIPPRTSAYDSSVDIQTKMDQTQKRLEKLQAKLGEREEAVRQSADTAKRRYLWSYVGLSVISIFDAVCKVILTVRPNLEGNPRLR
jgi:hypothetical protein